jgi:hypothetical protein
MRNDPQTAPTCLILNAFVRVFHNIYYATTDKQTAKRKAKKVIVFWDVADVVVW